VHLPVDTTKKLQPVSLYEIHSYPEPGAGAAQAGDVATPTLTPSMLLLPLSGRLQMSIVPAKATPPNRAGMPATRADTNRPNQIMRDPANDCM
jgi:hypothetical protein